MCRNPFCCASPPVRQIDLWGGGLKKAPERPRTTSNIRGGSKRLYNNIFDRVSLPKTIQNGILGRQRKNCICAHIFVPTKRARDHAHATKPHKSPPEAVSLGENGLAPFPRVKHRTSSHPCGPNTRRWSRTTALPRGTLQWYGWRMGKTTGRGPGRDFLTPKRGRWHPPTHPSAFQPN